MRCFGRKELSGTPVQSAGRSAGRQTVTRSPPACLAPPAGNPEHPISIRSTHGGVGTPGFDALASGVHTRVDTPARGVAKKQGLTREDDVVAGNASHWICNYRRGEADRQCRTVEERVGVQGEESGETRARKRPCSRLREGSRPASMPPG